MRGPRNRSNQALNDISEDIDAILLRLENRINTVNRLEIRHKSHARATDEILEEISEKHQQLTPCEPIKNTVSASESSNTSNNASQSMPVEVQE